MIDAIERRRKGNGAFQKEDKLIIVMVELPQKTAIAIEKSLRTVHDIGWKLGWKQAVQMEKIV